MRKLELTNMALLFYILLTLLSVKAFANSFVDSGISTKTLPRNARLEVLATKGKLTNELIEAFYEYEEKRLRDRTNTPKELWNWLKDNKVLYRGLLCGIHPDYSSDVEKCLVMLREEYGDRLEDYSHLALAFAFVYGRAGQGTIRAPWMDWVSKGRDVPEIKDSFGYYLEHEGSMIFPINKTPWPLLVFVADNDIPLSERKWVLSYYKNRPLESIKSLWGDVPRVKGAGALKMAKGPGTPMALPVLHVEGGVCSQQAYYSSRVLKNLGVPCIRLTGRRHAWEAWVLYDPPFKTYYHASVGNKDGSIFWPITRETVRQNEFDILVASMNRSYESYLDALIATHVFSLLPDDLKPKAVGLLMDAIHRNPYCCEPWRELAQACSQGVLSSSAGQEIYQKALRLLSEFPAFTCELFETIIRRDLSADTNITDVTIQNNVKIFEREIRRYNLSDRPDLAVRLTNNIGSYINSTKGPEQTLQLYSKWLAPIDHDWWYTDMLRHATSLVENKVGRDTLISFLEREYVSIPGKRNKKYMKDRGQISGGYSLVVKHLTRQLRAAGRKDEAAQIQNNFTAYTKGIEQAQAKTKTTTRRKRTARTRK